MGALKVLYAALYLSLIVCIRAIFMKQRQLQDGPGDEEISGNLSAAAVEIVRSSFHKIHTYNLYAYVEQPERRYLFGDIMENILKTVGKNQTVRVGMGEPVPGDDLRHFNVLLVDSAASLNATYAEFAKYHLYIYGYFVIVLHTFDSAHYYDVLFEIFELNWLLGIIDANVLVYALSNLSLLYNIHPFNQFHCKGLAPTIGNRFSNLHWRHTNFYPDKLADLHGCALVCATWEDMPYRGLIKGKPKEFGTLAGIEGKLLEYLAEKLNFTMTFQWLNDYESSHTLDKKGVVFRELIENGTDFVVGAFPYRSPTKEDIFTPTFPYFLSSFNFIVKSNPEPYSPFEKLFLPFNNDIWIFLLCIYLGVFALRLFVFVCSPAASRFIFGPSNYMPGVNMFGTCLGVGLPSHQLPQRNFARYILMLWLLLTMLLRSSYQAFLYNLIKSSIGRPPPNTIAELLRQEYQLLMTAEVLDTIHDLPAISSSAQILNISRFDSFEVVRETKHRIALLTPYEIVAFYKRYNASFTKGVHVVEERVFTQQLSFYMASNSMLLSRFNHIILKYINVGLWERWSRVLLDMNWRASEELEEAVTKVTLEQLYGAWYVWFIGVALSILIFLTEKLFNGQ